MSVGAIPNLAMPPSSEMGGAGAMGADRGVPLVDPVDVTAEGAAEVGAVGFDDILAGMVGHAAEMGNVAQGKAADFAAGRADDLHGTMIAAKKAEISLQLVGSVRNKLLDAFHELWRISV